MKHMKIKLNGMQIEFCQRLIKLNQSAKNQVELLQNNKNIKELESLQNDINKKVLIEGNKKE